MATFGKGLQEQRILFRNIENNCNNKIKKMRGTRNTKDDIFVMKDSVLVRPIKFTPLGKIQVRLLNKTETQNGKN